MMCQLLCSVQVSTTDLVHFIEVYTLVEETNHPVTQIFIFKF